MASRALRNGQLRLSLVSIPVEIHSARRSERKITFRQIHKPSGKRVRFTASMSKARRKARIFVDWLRNDRGATAIAPYARRPGRHACHMG